MIYAKGKHKVFINYYVREHDASVRCNCGFERTTLKRYAERLARAHLITIYPDWNHDART